MPTEKTLLTINGGSSSIKFTLYNVDESLTPFLSGKLTGLGLPTASLCVNDSSAGEVTTEVQADNYQQAVAVLLEWFQQHLNINSLQAIGHRIVHGGHQYKKPQWVTKDLLKHLSAITPLDPQHLPGEIQLIEALEQQFPYIKQLVCFDTEFHQTLPNVAKLLPIPRYYFDKGLYRYGFHGLSYQYLMQMLHQHEGSRINQQKIILAHLGNGASMAAIKNGQSIDTTMAMTPAAGLVMGTRSGDLDPGLFGLLNRSESMTEQQFETMINQQSGLLGISTTTSDMQQLLQTRSDDRHAEEAIDVFCYQAKKQIGAYAAALGGLDTLVFSGGIGENVAEIRSQICEQLTFMGIELDRDLNQQNALQISSRQSRVTVWVIPTDEELMIAQSMCDLLNLNH